MTPQNVDIPENSIQRYIGTFHNESSAYSSKSALYVLLCLFSQSRPNQSLATA